MRGPLDFRTRNDDATKEWRRRSDPLHAHIQPTGVDEWRVKLFDGAYHTVRLHLDHGAPVGDCDCSWWTKRSEPSPCAHLTAVYKAHWTNQNQADDPAGRDAYGDPIHIPTVDEIDEHSNVDSLDVEPDHGDLGAAMSEDRVRADGGERVERPADLRTEPRWTGR